MGLLQKEPCCYTYTHREDVIPGAKGSNQHEYGTNNVTGLGTDIFQGLSLGDMKISDQHLQLHFL